MEIDHVGETEVDLCSSCGGMWLDQGELEQIVGMAIAPEVAGTQYRKCPTCLKAMKRVVLGGIHVEQCALCEGLFLDAGELKQLTSKWKKTVRVASTEESLGEPTAMVCAKCNGRFPREQLYAVPGGHVCDKCSGFVSPKPELSKFEKFLWRIIEGLSTGHYRHHHHHHHIIDFID